MEKLFAGIHYYRFQTSFTTIEKLNNFSDVMYTINFQVVYNASLPFIGSGHNNPFEAFFSCLDGNRQ